MKLGLRRLRGVRRRYGRSLGGERTIYQRLRAANCTIEGHESDLYVKATEAAKRIVQNWHDEKPRGRSFGFFTDDIDHTRWIEIPFHYDPFWAKKRSR